MKSKKKTISINVDEELINVIKKLANANNRSVSNMTQLLLMKALKSIYKGDKTNA